jgi:hypothetical protein
MSVAASVIAEVPVSHPEKPRARMSAVAKEVCVFMLGKLRRPNLTNLVQFQNNRFSGGNGSEEA